MKRKKLQSNEISRLRARAEQIFTQKNKSDIKSNHDVYKLLHELGVHQVELEMQNEELRQAQIDLEETRNQYIDLYDFAPVGYFTLDANYFIEEANFAGAELLGIERKKSYQKSFTTFIVSLSKPVFNRHIKELLSKKTKQVFEIELIKKKCRPLLCANASVFEQPK